MNIRPSVVVTGDFWDSEGPLCIKNLIRPVQSTYMYIIFSIQLQFSIHLCIANIIHQLIFLMCLMKYIGKYIICICMVDFKIIPKELSISKLSSHRVVFMALF